MTHDSALEEQPTSFWEKVSRFTENQSKPVVITLSVLLFGGATLLDFILTPRGFTLPVFYLIPILFLSWFLDWRPALGATLLGGIANFIINQMLLTDSLVPHLVNGVIFVIYFGLARVTHTARLMLEFYFLGRFWRATHKPQRIGQRFFVKATWHTAADLAPFSAQPDDLVLTLGLGRAFGTGSHSTTQMCVALIEKYLRPGDRILDVGCGTGILSLAAVKLGAASALGLDINPEAARMTKENAELNGVASQIEFRLGSIDVIQNPTSETPNQKFPVVVANLLAYILIELLGQGLANYIAPGGVLIMSGIRHEQLDSILAAVARTHLTVIEQNLGDADWVALVVRPAESPR
jgi:ribosomal protein L11 methyltransferase